MASWQVPPTAVTGTIWTAANQNVYRDDLLVLSTAVLIPAHQSGNYYVAQGAITGAASGYTGVLTAESITIPVTGTYDRIGVYVVANAANNARLGIYNDNGGVPGSLLLDAGAISLNSTTLQAITISQSLTGPGKYWLACATDGATATLTSHYTNSFQGGTSFGNADPNAGAGRAFTYGALPDPFGAVATMSTVAAVRIRHA